MSRPPPSPNAAARSIHVFGVYLCTTGALLLLAPSLVLAPLQLEVPQDVWIRLVGVLALALGFTDLLIARQGVAALMRASVWRRLAAAAAMLGLVAIGLAPPAVTLFAAVDIAAAAWTALALRGLSAAPLVHA
ncbi:hypothetical protein [Ideonella sp. A 288]|uniref:hypothetical protein n=1 Tax=Ideonella sp. A 288 TaxID=1962181 RepID=UPI0011854F3C|nr:hypothetical protein [Ideonella sp. A 288]